MINFTLQNLIEIAAAGPVVARAKVAAALVNRRGQLVSLAHNQYKTHPLQARFSYRPGAIYLHAEIACIAQFLRSRPMAGLQNHTLLVARTWKDGTPALAKPCSGCQAAIAAFNIGDTQWTT